MKIGNLTETLLAQYKCEYSRGRPFIIGIDGLGGSGKTTITCKLKSELVAAGYETLILHIDDYIVERKKRYQTGNAEWYEYYYLQWDVELIQRKLFRKLIKNNSPITLPFYDHSTNSVYDKNVNIPSDAIIIIEGVFLLRKEWRRFFDFSIFLECSHELRSKRVLGRDVYLGAYETRMEKYRKRYWLAEDYYVYKENPIENADYIYRILENSDVQ